MRNLADGVGESDVTTRPRPIAMPVQTVTQSGRSSDLFLLLASGRFPAELVSREFSERLAAITAGPSAELPVVLSWSVPGVSHDDIRTVTVIGASFAAAATLASSAAADRALHRIKSNSAAFRIETISRKKLAENGYIDKSIASGTISSSKSSSPSCSGPLRF